MKLVIVGTGYVGLVSGLCFAEFGFETICVDKDEDRLKNLSEGKCPFYEPGLEDLLVKHLKSTNLLSLSSSLSDAMKDADIVFITVGTPTKRLEDSADLSSVFKVAEEIALNIKKLESLIVSYGSIWYTTIVNLKKRYMLQFLRVPYII